MSRHPRALPQRIEWFEGSRLSRRDLADAIQHEARMLELHVRATHDTEGIAFGLTAVLSADARSVTVQPGLAYTCRGASVLLHSPTVIAAPPLGVPGNRFDLVLVGAAPPSCGAPTLDCTGARIPVRATLRWIAVEEERGCTCTDRDDVIYIGRFVRTPSGALAGPDNARRRAVRGLTRPHVASGATAPGALAWQQGTMDLSAQIDTSVAGFTTAPVYLASIASPTPWLGGLVAPFVSVGQATPTHFTVHLMIAAKPPAIVLLFAQLALVKELSISWTGVESAVGCSDGGVLYTALLPGITIGGLP
ncbi:MAG: hypothetical protein JWL95_639 [Gemmatimonadetes bacterium]|nr:hypothetical protein [Gemmatimonadota bacterium]